MNQDQVNKLPPQMATAIRELRAMITARYPDALFEIARSTDEPKSIHLITTVDIEDTDSILDLVIERVLELNVEEGIPIHVIPVQPIERILAAVQPSGAHA